MLTSTEIIRLAQHSAPVIISYLMEEVDELPLTCGGVTKRSSTPTQTVSTALKGAPSLLRPTSIMRSVFVHAITLAITVP